MKNELSEANTDALLQDQKYGHLGCVLPDGRVYVVPITYAYADGNIYSFSYPGQKIDALRARPSVCFQAERSAGEAWESVIAWGEYEELNREQRLEAMKAIFKRIGQEDDTTMSPLFRIPEDKQDAFIFYRIRVTQKTGRRVQSDY